MTEKRSVVAIAKEIDQATGLADVQASVTKVFDLLGGVTKLIARGDKVVLKPNAGHAEGPETAVCTSPAVVRAVIREVKKAMPIKSHCSCFTKK